MDHIDSLDVMRAGIGFRSIGQRDPLVEFKNEAFRMFDDLKQAIQHYIVDSLLKLLRNDFTITIQRPEPQRKTPRNVRTNVDEIAKASGQAKSDVTEERTRGNARKGGAGRNGTGRNGTGPRGAARAPVTTATRPTSPTKVGRNDPCPCGSGLKYKKCHGK
jgi:preprotein translocase subunit SecA